MSLPRASGLRAVARRVVSDTNGSPVVLQMQVLSERAVAAGGAAIDAPARARDYQARMAAARGARRASTSPRALLVPGAAGFVAKARAAGFACAVVSGSSADDVASDLAFLGLSGMFGDLVRSPADPAVASGFSKERAFRDLMAACAAQSLVAFGDGPGEIRAALAVGGVGVGIAHIPGSAAADPALSVALARAGASFVAADFLDPRCWAAAAGVLAG